MSRWICRDCGREDDEILDLDNLFCRDCGMEMVIEMKGEPYESEKEKPEARLKGYGRWLQRKADGHE